MNPLVDQTHGANSSFPVGPHMPLIKNTPRLQCTIPKSSLKTRHLDPSLEASTLSAMLEMDNKLVNSITLDGDQSNIDHIAILERVVCSNFFCCSTQHSDLHALLAHFERDHVVVLAPNGKRVFPVALHPSSGESTPASSRSSSVSPSLPSSPITPPFSIPSSPSDANFSASLGNRKPGLAVQPVYTPFTPCWPLDPAYSLPDPSEIVIVQEPTFDFSTQPSLLPPLQLEAPETLEIPDSEDEADDETPWSPSSSSHGRDTPRLDLESEIPKAIRSLAKGKRGGGGQPESTARHATSSKPSKSRRGVSSSVSHSRRREKMYRCPKDGCVKAYLNPNGLKYHLEKGTCKLEDDDAQSSAEQPVAPPSSTSAGSHPVSSLDSQSPPSIVSRRPSPVPLPVDDVPVASHIGLESLVPSHASHPEVPSTPLTQVSQSIAAQQTLSYPSPRPLQTPAHVIQQRHHFNPVPFDQQPRLYQPQQSYLHLTTDSYPRRNSSQGVATLHSQPHHPTYHYPVPSYPQGYALQHRDSFHDGAAYHNAHAALMGGTAPASSATSQ